MRVATASDPSRVRVAASLVAGSLLLAGCGRILGLDDYSPGAASGPDAGRCDASAVPATDALPVRADARTLFDPKPPYLTGNDCAACMSANCAKPAAACATDGACSAWLTDAQANPGPVSAFTRFRQITTALWDAERQHDGGVATVPQNDLRACARAACTRECELGRDFSCLGNFEWPRSFPTETDLRFRFVNASDTSTGLPNFDVRACIDAACAPPLAKGATDALGFVRSTPGADGFAIREPMTIRSQYPEFNGFLLFDGEPTSVGGGSAFYPLVMQFSRPWVSGDYQVSYLTRAVMAPYFTLLKEPFDPTLAYYTLQPFDCREEPAKGVTAEFQIYDGSTYRPCDACRIMYSDDHNIPKPELTDFSSLGQIAYASTPAQQSILVLRDEKSGQVVAALSPVTLPGHFHYVGLYPPSAAQLAEFPPGARQ